MAQPANSELSINFDDWLRSRLARYVGRPVDRSVPALDGEQELRIALRAVRLYAESHPRPPHVTIKQAAEMLGLSRHTVSKMLHAGRFKLSQCGLTPIGQVDAALLPV